MQSISDNEGLGRAADPGDLQVAATRAAEHELRAALVVAEGRERNARLTRDAEIARMQVGIIAEQHVRAKLRTQLEALGDENRELRAQVLVMGDKLATADQIVRRVNESVAWQAFQGLRAALYRVLGGERSLPARVFSGALRSVGRLSFFQPTPSVVEPQAPVRARDERAVASEATRPRPVELSIPRVQTSIAFPEFADPTVSLIIPLRNGAELTRACLESIRDHTSGVSYEVVIVDDDADQETKHLLTCIRGGLIVVNDQNVGYLRSINHAVTLVRGRWLVLCNNDIQVQPGWLRAMMACAESESDIGIVTPKYVYPDGRLNEAGGIQWRNGNGVNYGRGDDPQRPAYNYRRPVDWGSAAALLVRTDLFSDVGGYDERYVPMYYEDTDLCFQVRQRGMRVMYEPEAVVMHVEGGTAGTDPLVGHKRHEEENRMKFVSKWADTLDAGYLQDDNHRQAADRLATGHVLLIDHHGTMWNGDSGSGSARMMGIIRSLQKLGFQLTVIPDNSVPAQPYARQLQRMGIEVLQGAFDVYRDLKSCAPLLSGVLLGRSPVCLTWLSLVRELAPAATVVYDSAGLPWLSECYDVALNGSSTAMAADASAVRELGLEMVRTSDATLVTTDGERRILERESPGARLHIVPNLHDIAEQVPRAAGRSGIIFVGGFGDPADTDAVRQLVEVIMPRVWRRLPDVPVRIVGSNPPVDVLSLQRPLVDVIGWIEDVEASLHASRLMVAPLRFGAGMKGRITQSLALGLPVVTTAVGAEGLETGVDRGLLVAGESMDLADRIVEAYTDDELWERLSEGGQTAMARTCSPALADEVFRLLLGGIPPLPPVGSLKWFTQGSSNAKTKARGVSKRI